MKNIQKTDSFITNKVSLNGSAVFIKKNAIIENYNIIQSKVSANTKIIPVIKNNAYGLTIQLIVPVLLQCKVQEFFVANFFEACELQKFLQTHNVEYKIYVLLSFLPNQLDDFYQYGFIPVLNTKEEVLSYNQFAKAKKKSLCAVLQLETGMNRLGLCYEDTLHIKNNIDSYLSNINIDFIMSHFACADVNNNPANLSQCNVFLQLQDNLPKTKYSLSASYGIFLDIPKFEDIIRPAIALYGGNPTPYKSNPMQNVIYFFSSILQIKKLKAGDKVGYGLTWMCDVDSEIAIVSIGYADGILRNISQNAVCYIDNIPIKIVGRVSMDCISIDITHLPQHLKKIGQIVELIGDNLSLDDFAKQSNTIHCEILNNLSVRYPRYVI